MLRAELYAVPALAGAGIVVLAHGAGARGVAFPVISAAVCLALRLAGLPYGLAIPLAPSERKHRRSGD